VRFESAWRSPPEREPALSEAEGSRRLARRASRRRVTSECFESCRVGGETLRLRSAARRTPSQPARTPALLRALEPRALNRYNHDVVSPWSIWYPILDTVADSVNPLLAFFAIVTVVTEWRRSSRYIAGAHAIAATLGLAGIYIVRALVKLSIWHAPGGHYSTHAAFAMSIVISLAVWLPRRRAILVTILLAYDAFILIMGYHSAADVLTGSVVACIVTVPWHLAARSIALRRA